jgi:TPR repeat protein
MLGSPRFLSSFITRSRVIFKSSRIVQKNLVSNFTTYDESKEYDQDIFKWLSSAHEGDAESAFQLGLLLRKHGELDAKDAESSEATDGPSVLKEIQHEKKEARIRRKEKIKAKNSSPKMVEVHMTNSNSMIEEVDELAATSWQHWIRQAISRNHGIACVYLGNILLYHNEKEQIGGTAIDILEAVQLYKKAVKISMSTSTSDNYDSNSNSIGNFRADALFNLGTIYFSGAEDTKGTIVINQDKKKSIEYYKQAADLGDVGAIYWVGHCLISGEGGINKNEIDIIQGLNMLEKAANQEHPAAYYYLATIYRSGLKSSNIDCVDVNIDLFNKYLDLAIDAGDSDACFCKADLYMNGIEGYPLDEKKSISYMQIAADKNHIDAIVNLGTMHFTGRGGLNINKRKAFELYNQAAELGSKDAWMNLASMHYNGDGIPKSESIAREIMKHIDSM